MKIFDLFPAARIAVLGLLCGVAGCGALPSAAPLIVQHDLGGSFPLAQSRPATALRSVTVTALPMAATTAMQYRDAASPTLRSAYAYNRWAAPPAALTEAALGRLLAVPGTGRCRVQVVLGDFLLETEGSKNGRAHIAAELRLYDGNNLAGQRSLDVTRALSQVDPAMGALGLREAVIELGRTTAGWVDGEAGKACRS